jgi:hypothetical protein
MAKLHQLPRPMVRRGARFHPDQTRWLFLEEGKHPASPQLATENHAALRVNAMDLKNVLRKIDTYRDSFIHGRLLFPCGY